MRNKLLSISVVAVLSVILLTGCADKVTEVSAEPTIEAVENKIAEATATVEPETTKEPEVETIETEEIEVVETEVDDVEDEDDVEEVEEPKTSAKVEDEKLVETEKPVETPAPTEKPVETPTPEPVHTHNHVLVSSTSGANCTNSGVDTYTCECGDSYTTANNNYGAHTWTTENWSETVHHDAETQTVHGYACDCGIFWPISRMVQITEGNSVSVVEEKIEGGIEAYLKHDQERWDAFKASQVWNEDHTAYTFTESFCTGYGTSSRLVEVSPAYDEVVTHTRTYCTNCGAEQ